MTNYLHFGENPIWFSSHKEMWIFVKMRSCRKSLPSNFCIYVKCTCTCIHLHKPFKRSVECSSVHCVVWVSFLSKFGWKGLMTWLIKILIFLRDYWTKSDGVFAEMQIISYNFIILKHIQINSQFRKILMLKVWLSSFWEQSLLCKKRVLITGICDMV